MRRKKAEEEARKLQQQQEQERFQQQQERERAAVHAREVLVLAQDVQPLRVELGVVRARVERVHVDARQLVLHRRLLLLLLFPERAQLVRRAGRVGRALLGRDQQVIHIEGVPLQGATQKACRAMRRGGEVRTIDQSINQSRVLGVAPEWHPPHVSMDLEVLR